MWLDSAGDWLARLCLHEWKTSTSNVSRQQRTIAHSKPLRNPGSIVTGRRRGWNVDHVYKHRGLKSMIVICGHVWDGLIFCV